MGISEFPQILGPSVSWGGKGVLQAGPIMVICTVSDPLLALPPSLSPNPTPLFLGVLQEGGGGGGLPGPESGLWTNAQK